jgi:Phytanoyl-CoA dioxygenase (PhyH)
MTAAPTLDTPTLAEAIRRDGFAGLPGAFSRQWGERLREDFDTLFAEARAMEEGTVGRGPQRYYFSIHPERLRGFVDLVTHPTVTALCEHMLGPDYQVVETAFDVPLPGAVHQPWHRDFPMPEETRREGRLSSLAFNVTGADVTPDMGPFELAPGTQFDDGAGWRYEMFPPRSAYPRYDALASQRLPQLGDASVRTGLAVHRGTPNRSDTARPVLVLGVVAPEVDTSDAHALALSAGYYDALPAEVVRHLRATRVEALEPLRQQHSIEGLVMGE